MHEIVFVHALISLVIFLGLSAQITKLRKQLFMKIRIEDTTLNSLVSLAESAVAADAHDKADLVALQATVANEQDLPADLKTRIDALIPPPADTTAATTPPAA
jgi:hypothetical protein